jgi:hypothetical protein
MSKYALLNDGDDREMAEQEIDKLLWGFADKYQALAERFPTAGIGDTATDELVADEFYEILHYGCLWKRPVHCIF